MHDSTDSKIIAVGPPKLYIENVLIFINIEQQHRQYQSRPRPYIIS